MIDLLAVNTPTHIAAGVWIAQMVMLRWSTTSVWRRIGAGAVCFAGGLITHLALDALPHFAWVIYLPVLESLPFHWLIREGLLATVVAIPLFYVTRAIWPYAVLAMCGALYPDAEKVAAADLNVSPHWIIFKQHSIQLSSNDGGLPHCILIATEIAITAAFIIATMLLARIHGRTNGTSSQKSLKPGHGLFL